MSTNYGFEPTLSGLNNIDADSSTTTNIICDTIQINSSGTAPTVSALSNNTNIATTAWVTSHAVGSYVTISGTQTISGQKTFSNANTYISGNTVTNSIQSSVTTNDINIGTLLTTGDINFATIATSTNVALNWGTTSNSGILTFRGGSFNLLGTGVTTLSCGAAFAMDIATSQTSGILSIGTAAGRTAATNIATGSTTGTTVTIGSASGGTTTLNCGTLNLSGTANSRLGANMTSGAITIGGGSSSATAINIGSTQTNVTSTINIATVVTGNAPVNIGSVNSSTQKLTFHSQDFNINTGFLPINNVGSLTIGGADIYLNSTDTTCNGNFNVYNIIGSSGANLTISTTGTDDITITSAGDTIVYSPNLIMSTNTALIFAGSTPGTGIQYTNPLANEFDIKLLNVADTLYYVDNAGVSIFYVRANEFNSDVPTRFTDNVTINTGQTFTLGSPATINYPTTTSYSETSASTVLTYIGGTFRSIVTWSNWATSTGFYIFNRTTAVAGWTNGGTQGSGSGGYFSCPAGVYTYNLSIIFEDGTAYNITDFKGALVDINTLTAASNDSTIIAGTMGNNFTCFRHQVTTITPAATDTPGELMSGTFRITTATNLYVWFRINNSAAGGINSVYFDLSITRIS